MSKLVRANEYEEIAKKLIDKYPVAFNHIILDEVLFLKEEERTPKNKYADTRIIKSPYTYFSDYKFIITFYENNILSMTEAQKVLLVYHELLHIDPSFSKLVNHDIQDFRILLSKWGCCWDIDPNLPNILEDEDKDLNISNSDDDEDEEPNFL